MRLLLGAILLAMLAPLQRGAAQEMERRISVRGAEHKKIARIRFERHGERPFKSSELRSAMHLREGGRFARRFFSGDLAEVLKLYRARGYRSAQILSRRLLLDRKDRLHITLVLDSGTRWKVRDVRFEGGSPFAPEFLAGLVAIKPGSVFNYGAVLEGERALQRFLNSRGYAHARVDNRLDEDNPGTHSAVVVYRVEPGQRMFFGALRIVGEKKLLTRRKLIEEQLTFKRGDLYDPERLAQSRNRLAHTELFRAITFSTPPPAGGDSLQAVELRLREKKFLSLGASIFFNNTDRRLAASIQHSNWLGRGGRLGLDLAVGRPIQGLTLFLTENNLFHSGVDLILSGGISDEWSNTEVRADPGDERQFDFLTSNDSVLEGLLFFSGLPDARLYIQDTRLSYRSVERVWKAEATLSRQWSRIYQAHISVNWTRARNRPDRGTRIRYMPPGQSGGTGDGTDSGGGLFGDGGNGDLFGDGGNGGLFGDGQGEGDAAGGDDLVDIFDTRRIRVDRFWEDILSDRSRSINLSAEFQRDSRDNRIAPARGSFVRLTGLYAVKLGSESTFVLDGDFEGRHYQPLARGLVLALAARAVQTASLRQGRPLPQVFWKEFGGEGSLRGARRNAVQAVGGGRTGLNLRSELRYAQGDLGLVLFWDRAEVWRHTREISLLDMVDGYGAGVRYTRSIPFRFDVATSPDDNEKLRVYFSIGQAF